MFSAWKFCSVWFARWHAKWDATQKARRTKHITSAKRPGGHPDGAKAEILAADFLHAQGLEIIARNYRVAGGEIDLIAREKTSAREKASAQEIIIFVEVRLRRSQRFGGAAASIVAEKRRRIMLAAQHWLMRQRGRLPCRFDCILLNRLDTASIQWIQHAFRADD